MGKDKSQKEPKLKKKKNPKLIIFVKNKKNITCVKQERASIERNRK